MAQQRYDITLHDPTESEAKTFFKQTPREIIELLRWALIQDTGLVEKNPVKVWAISKCAE